MPPPPGQNSHFSGAAFILKGIYRAHKAGQHLKASKAEGVLVMPVMPQNSVLWPVLS